MTQNEQSKPEILVTVAMEQEAKPFLDLADVKKEFTINDTATAWELEYLNKKFILSQSNVGKVNASTTVTSIIDSYEINYVFSAGTAGGMGENIRVGDIVCGTKYTYNGADARMFGYVLGQIPNMPPEYYADKNLLDLVARNVGEKRVFLGQIISGDSFVTEKNIGSKRKDYPEALATDMESTAIAQVCYLHKIKFLSVRCISDLCGPSAEKDFYMDLDKVTLNSAKAVLEIIKNM